MQDLARAKQQFFKLMRLVKKDYELQFVVDQNKFFAVIGQNQKIALCIMNRRWEPVNATDLFELEDFLAHFLRSQKNFDEKLTENIRSALFGHAG